MFNGRFIRAAKAPIRLAGRGFASEVTPSSSRGPWGWYLQVLERRPVLTKAITSGFLTFTADVLCQLYFPSRTVREAIEEQKSKSQSESNDKRKLDGSASDILMRLQLLDTKRLGIFTLLGVGYIAPCLHLWYGFLMRAISGVSTRATLTRVFFDQSCFAPTFLAGLFSLGLLLEGRGSVAAVKRKITEDLPPTVAMNWSM